MGGTINQVDVKMSILQMSTAAINVSGITSTKQGGGQEVNSFDSFLNKASANTQSVKADNPGKKPNVTSAKDTKKETDQNSDDITYSKVEDNGTVKKEEATHDKNQKNELQDDNTKVDSLTAKENNTVSNTNTNGSKEETNIDEDVNKLQEAILEIIRDLMNKITESFDLSEEDIENAMQVLGLSAGDLLIPQNIQSLVVNVTGEDKALDLITDSDLYTKMQDLIEGAEGMRSELMKEFDLSPKELEPVLQDISESFGKEIITDEELDEQPIEIDFVEDKTIKPLPTVKPETVEENTDEDTLADLKAPQSENLIKAQPEKTMADNQKEITTSEIDEKEFKPVENARLKENSGKENGSNNTGTGSHNTNLLNEFLNNLTDSVNTDQTTGFTYTDRVQMENIVRQITEKITVFHGAEESSIEMQLHPASLGNVHILLTSAKDGIIAKFTAQNEIVKEAVESQMIQLQQKFEEQGIKVTSVEVTIASHAFEQNLQQNDKNEAFEEARTKSKKSIRRINLSEDGVEPEEMDDADRLAAQMMAINGNTVDYSA